MNEKRPIDLLRCLFFPPKCCSCGEFLQEHILDTEARALCEICRRKWEYAKLSVCHKCGEELSRCRCMPVALKGAGCSALLKMVSYDKNRDSVAKRCVIFMKRKNVHAVFDFFSAQLARLLKEYLDETYTSAFHVFVTFVPRGVQNALKSGVDQSELLARGIAENLGCSFGRLLGRKSHFAKEQKKLGRKERLESAENLFCLAEQDLGEINKRYRCVVLVDDVVTTGASLSSCLKLLKEPFAGRIVCLSLAQTSATE